MKSYMRELPEAAHVLHNIRKSPSHGDRAIATASRTERPHLVELPILLPFQTLYSLSTHFSDDYFVFRASLSCFILLFKNISRKVSPVGAAVQLSRTFCHLWLPELNYGSYFVKQSFSLLPHPNKRADPESCQQSSLHHPALLDCHCFPQRWSDLEGLGGYYFWGCLTEAVTNLWHHRFLLETHAGEACTKQTSWEALQSLFALCQWHRPLALLLALALAP